MGNSESSWRSQLSFIFSLLLHAGAIALIALGPTMIENRFGNQGTQPQPVDMTIVSPPASPKTVAAKIPEVVVKPAPVVEAKAPVHRVHKVAKIKPKPIVKKVAAVTPALASPVKIQPAPVKAPVAVSKPIPQEAPAPVPQPQVKPQPQPVQPAPTATVATQNTAVKSAGPATPSVAGSPTGSRTITVTQNYLSLRQLPGNQPPVYTHDMRLKREQGVGQLVYFVNRNGTVSDVRLIKSTGFPELDKAAIDAFSKYRFVPGQQGYTVHNFEFVLNGPAIADGPGLRTTMN